MMLSCRPTLCFIQSINPVCYSMLFYLKFSLAFLLPFPTLLATGSVHLFFQMAQWNICFPCTLRSSAFVGHAAGLAEPVQTVGQNPAIIRQTWVLISCFYPDNRKGRLLFSAFPKCRWAKSFCPHLLYIVCWYNDM